MMPSIRCPVAPDQMRVQTVFFDLDGTIVDSVSGIEAAIHHAVSAHRPAHKPLAVRSLIGPPAREILRRYSALMESGGEAALTDAELEEAHSLYRAAYDGGLCDLGELYEGVLPALQQMRATGLTLYIVTNKPSLPAMRVLQAQGIFPLFKACISPDGVYGMESEARPAQFADKTAMTRHLLDAEGLDPSHTVFVGDSTDDALAATSCDLSFVAAPWGYGDAAGSLDPRSNPFIPRNWHDLTAHVLTYRPGLSLAENS